MLEEEEEEEEEEESKVGEFSYDQEQTPCTCEAVLKGRNMMARCKQHCTTCTPMGTIDVAIFLISSLFYQSREYLFASRVRVHALSLLQV